MFVFSFRHHGILYKPSESKVNKLNNCFDDANCYINKQYDSKMLLMLTITGKSVLTLAITIIFLLISTHCTNSFDQTHDKAQN